MRRRGNTAQDETTPRHAPAARGTTETLYYVLVLLLPRHRGHVEHAALPPPHGQPSCGDKKEEGDDSSSSGAIITPHDEEETSGTDAMMMGGYAAVGVVMTPASSPGAYPSRAPHQYPRCESHPRAACGCGPTSGETSQAAHQHIGLLENRA